MSVVATDGAAAFRDVAAMVVLVAGGSEAATLFGLDGIVGAFTAGIAERRAIQHEEPTHVLKLVANTFLIPSFFMATGMLIQPALLDRCKTAPPRSRLRESSRWRRAGGSL